MTDLVSAREGSASDELDPSLENQRADDECTENQRADEGGRLR